MKYTKLFNNHEEYMAYTASTSFIRPNVSYCILEDEPHCTPQVPSCQEEHRYEVVGMVSYPSEIPASATSFDLSFNYNDIFITTTCYEMVTSSSDTVSISVHENLTMSAITISGSYNFHGIEIPYSVVQDGRETPAYEIEYLTLDVLTSGDIAWKSRGDANKTISYSKDSGTTWNEITSTSSGTVFSVTAGDKVLLKGNNNEYASGQTVYSSFDASELANAATYNVQGNIMSLIDGDDFIEPSSFKSDWALAFLFYSSNVVSAENLVLPLLALRTRCYASMFFGCTNLVKVPKLPATTLANSCYSNMFYNCTSLTSVPTDYLPSTTLAVNCYSSLFNGCSSLTTAPDLPATTLYETSYHNMFNGCSSLTAVPSLSATTLASSCCEGMFNGCTSLTSVSTDYLPATTSATECYYQMFKG